MKLTYIDFDGKQSQSPLNFYDKVDSKKYLKIISSFIYPLLEIIESSLNKLFPELVELLNQSFACCDKQRRNKINKERNRIVLRVKPSIYWYLSELMMAKVGLNLYELNQFAKGNKLLQQADIGNTTKKTCKIQINTFNSNS